MIDKEIFMRMRESIESFEEKREEIIKLAKDILKQSKKSIFACHRGNLNKARELLDKVKKKIFEMKKLVVNNHYLITNLYYDALEEFVESECFYSFLKNKKIPSNEELNVSVELYLQGLCDLTGELTRKAVNDLINGDKSSVFEIKEFVSELYEELLQFDFRNSSLRRKYDAIKYSLEKLESLALKIKLKN